MKNFIPMWAFALAFLGLVSCSDDNGVIEVPDGPSNPTQPTNPNAEINDYIWGGLNLWYLWQANVPDLGDARFGSDEEYQTYLNVSPEPEVFFESLLYDTSNVDVYSWIVDDYQDLENFLGQSSESNGVDFQLVRYSSASNDIFGFVKLIIPDSDASDKNIKRGDLFTEVDGIQLTIDNYRELLYTGSNTYTLTLASIEENVIAPTGEFVELSKSELVENNVHTTSIIEEAGKKIGYLHYTFFSAASESLLNDAFLEFNNENITNLVLDLRYNPGGYGYVSQSLASLITGQFKGEVFSRDEHNSKIQAIYESLGEEYYIEKFVDETSEGQSLNSLNLNEVHIITSDGSASACESLIVGLNPFIDVTLVGDRTFGKYTGSITMYDSENYTKENVNPNHTYAMQPIVAKFVNSLGESPQGGLAPDLFVLEDIENMGVLGDRSEPLLSVAINDIVGVSAKKDAYKTRAFEKVSDYRTRDKYNLPLILDSSKYTRILEKMQPQKR